ncbi:hypothetical protein H0O00_02220 [Candidatus Micrarchaeota archaeon]|nr:hypothetical protein [Candidatus Micrarchaeota archaeon]
MDRPEIPEGPITTPTRFKCMGRTQNLLEAERIAQQYRMRGFEVRVNRKMQGSITIYEVWVAKEPDILSGKGEPPAMR